MNFVYKCYSALDTLDFAKKLASHLQKEDVIVLLGELGAGKTKFTEGILSYFNLQDDISSPTFTIVNEYMTQKFPIYHFDVYRLENVSEFYEIGGQEYFESGVSIIEWGEIIKEALPNEYIQISIEKDLSDDNIRILNIETFGDRFDNYFKEIIN